MNAVSEGEVHVLEEEVATLKKEIAELRRKLNENAYERLRQSTSTMEECFIPSLRVSDDLTIDPSADPLQILSVNEQLNGITFSNIRKTYITPTHHHLEAECRVLDLQFNVSCDLSYETDSIRVLSSETIFQDPLLVAEVAHFINSCHRERNLQELLTGIVQYSTLRQLRQTVLDFLCTDCTSSISLNHSVDHGKFAINICVSGNDDPYLTCTWNIDWDKKRHMMRQFLEIHCHTDDVQPELQNYLKELCDEPYSDAEEMKNVWQEIVNTLPNQTKMV